ncbi:cobalt-precorrin 5A hydrolase [uncultured Intestinimonas sp.]|uniref:cobalt-precorrin 5A hydrolase n=1 Tax=uncultured Intestinimonas sp. TaxID=1689265 RepID=UPI0025D1D698|nr:cobalt-precorrin 5A hydrolase [uncultured Intestinimonas sp.]
MKLALTAFTRKGADLAGRLARALEKEGDRCETAFPRRLAGELGAAAYPDLKGWTAERFPQVDGFVFVGACGIAVRAVAPLLRDKFTDPAVVAVDELGRFAVPLVSGHVGGANDLARRIAAATGGAPVVSTATDVNGLFAVDQWAAREGLYLDSRTAAKHISATLLAGEPVWLQSDIPIQGELPPGVRRGTGPLGIYITAGTGEAPFGECLRLIPRILALGIGCRRGTPAERIGAAVDRALSGHGLSPRAVQGAYTIDRKGDEPGLLAFCRERELPLATYTAEELRRVPGAFTASPFVVSVTGVDNVCERAAVLAGGELIVRKQAAEGVTVAVSRLPRVLRFDGYTDREGEDI